MVPDKHHADYLKKEVSRRRHLGDVEILLLENVLEALNVKFFIRAISTAGTETTQGMNSQINRSLDQMMEVLCSSVIIKGLQVVLVMNFQITVKTIVRKLRAGRMQYVGKNHLTESVLEKNRADIPITGLLVKIMTDKMKE